MNWLGFFAALALAAMIISLVTDLEMTKCQSGSAYAMLRFCKPDVPAPTILFDCRFGGGCG